jgi:hypothetical protein
MAALLRPVPILAPDSGVSKPRKSAKEKRQGKAPRIKSQVKETRKSD